MHPKKDKKNAHIQQMLSYPHSCVCSISILNYEKKNEDNNDDCWGANAESSSVLTRSLENWNTEVRKQAYQESLATRGQT